MADIQSLGQSGHHFTNWAETYSCTPELYFEPQSEEEIRQILSVARIKNKKVKVVGFGHSPSDLACTTDYMISLKKFNKELKVDKDKGRVKVQAGVLVKELNNQILPKYGLGISVLGAISDISLAGAICTGTHGSGANYGNLSTYVVALEIMTSSGEVIECSEEVNRDIFYAARVSLGALGVILTITFQCEPEFKLERNTYPAKLQDVLENLDVHLKASEHFRFIWFPHTEYVSVWHMNRTSKPVQTASSWFWDSFIGFYMLEFLFWLSTFFPSLVPVINTVYFQLLFNNRSSTVDRSDRVFNFNCLFKQFVTEWAIPRSNTAVVLYELQEWLDKSGYKAHFPVEVRFVKGDEIYLSPAYGRETCYINLVSYRPYMKTVPYDEYWTAFEGIMMRAGGRPHWAKNYKVTQDEFRQIYPKWDAFCEIRQKMDPNGMFMNANLERIFGRK